MKRWRWALASQAGTSHLRLGTRKQDAVTCFTVAGKKGQQLVCAMVSDGAGSAQYGGEGASLTCRRLSQTVRQHFNTQGDMPNAIEVESWINSLRDQMTRAANNRKVGRKEFACTLVLLLLGQHESMIVHIGDGAIVGREGRGEWKVLSWPENGEYASSTYFITDEPMPRIRFVEADEIHTAYALFTDGIEDIALESLAKTAHAPFFSKMIYPIDHSSARGKDQDLSLALAAFLVSDRVCERTDDDKTLILLSALDTHGPVCKGFAA